MSTVPQTWPRHLSASSIERVDVDRAGRRVLTLCEQSSLQWWSESVSGWNLTGPIDDTDLPFHDRLGAELGVEGTRVISWKPGRRLTLLALRGDRPVVIKAYRKSGFDAALDAHRKALVLLERSLLEVAPLVAVHPESRSLEFAFIAGSPLEVAETSFAHFFRLGAGLRHLQTSATDALREHTLRDELDVIGAMRQRSINAGGELPAGFGAALARLGNLAPRAVSKSAAACHRDLHDGQILRSVNRLTCLDFDLLCLADPALDAANLVSHLQLRALQQMPGANAASALECARAFLEGLDREAESGFSARLCWYQAATFLRLAAVHAMRPRWARLVNPLLGLAVRCMEDLEHE